MWNGADWYSVLIWGLYKTIRGYLSVCKYNEILPLKRHPLQWGETSGRIPADAQLIGL